MPLGAARKQQALQAVAFAQRGGQAFPLPLIRAIAASRPQAKANSALLGVTHCAPA